MFLVGRFLVVPAGPSGGRYRSMGRVSSKPRSAPMAYDMYHFINTIEQGLHLTIFLSVSFTEVLTETRPKLEATVNRKQE